MGTGPRAAARQAALLLALAGALALVGMTSHPAGADQLLMVAIADFAVALVALAVPWARAGPNSSAVLGLPSFAVLGFSTWAFGGIAAGTGPFLVLLYAWAGLHFPRWILLAYVAPATLAYVLPLIVTGQPPLVVSSAVILMPIALAVALLIEAQARHLRDDRERLARIERWRAAMVGALAHDVRSPLTTVQVALESAREDATGPIARMLDAALRQTAHIARLADSLLDAERIDSSGRLTLDRRDHDALTLVRDALSYVRVGDQMTVEVEPGLTVHVDEQRFQQIVINLANNAVRYGKPPFVVRLTREGPVDRLEVRDHGPGIPDELRATLFGQFAAAGRESVGLGLWIVRQFARAHGGDATALPRTPGVAMVATFDRQL